MILDKPMRYATLIEEKMLLPFLFQTIEQAKQSTCERSACGSIIVSEDTLIGTGFNSPPHQAIHKRCTINKDTYHKKVTDKTCCVHAEQRAILDALRTFPQKIIGSRLYFIRLDKNSNPLRAGKPYCTICSKLALDVGIAEFILWHKDGIVIYPTAEYNELSFAYSEESQA